MMPLLRRVSILPCILHHDRPCSSGASSRPRRDDEGVHKVKEQDVGE